MTDSDHPAEQSRSSLLRGAGSNELIIDSADPMELRALLERARERLSFYEGFDRLIAENVRRSGELMLESLSMRDTVAASATLHDEQERTRVANSLDGMTSDLAALRIHLAALDARILDLRQSLDTPKGDPGRPEALALSTSEEVAPVSRDREESRSDGWDGPRTVEIIAHGVGKAATALSLQRYLGALPSVVGVEAREFAEGVLRLQVTASLPFQREALAGWTDGGLLTILQLHPDVVEIELG